MSEAEFITDAGFPVILTWGDEELDIGRYGVWGDKGRGKPEVIDTGNDLDALKEKHGELPVYELPRR
jgi:hypothetical protein